MGNKINYLGPFWIFCPDNSIHDFIFSDFEFLITLVGLEYAKSQSGYDCDFNAFLYKFTNKRMIYLAYALRYKGIMSANSSKC